MIVVSLLLILVAVTLLVLGLTGGSSALLISSIVASLLAAVFLVIGARQAAARRRTAAAAPDGVPADRAHDPYLAGAAPADLVDEPARGARVAAAAPAGSAADRGDVPSDFSRSDTFSPGKRSAAAAGPQPDDRAPQADEPAPQAHDPSSPVDDRAPQAHDRSPQADDEAPQAHDLSPQADDRDDRRAAPGIGDDGRDAARSATGGREAPDYDHASSVIGATRTAHDDDQSWRRDPDPAPPVAQDADEFGEPDADDPADEPLPQAVRPGDAVRMARIDAEVLVVDGRPRYHLADCPHLAGRLTEPLPAREAVELGFSPCGLCRPVDRLVAQAAHH
jgi:clumping factor A